MQITSIQKQIFGA